LILKFLDAESLGFYSLGTLIFAPLFIIFSTSNSVMYPRFAEKYGETGSPYSLRRYITVPMENLAALISILIGAIYIALPALVRVFLPEYNEGIPAARILIFGLFFYAVRGMAGNMLLTINKQVLYLGIMFGAALLNLIFSYSALKLGYGIVGIAVGTSLAYFVYFLISTILAMRFSQASLIEIIKLFVKVLGPICYVGIVVIIFSMLMPVGAGKLSSMITQTIFRELVFFILTLYFIYKISQGKIVNLFVRRNNIKL